MSNAEQQIMKAELLVKRRAFDKAVESLGAALEAAREEDDFPALVRANCFLGEMAFMRGDYPKAAEHLAFVSDHSEEAESFDDLLAPELQTSELLLSLMERYVDSDKEKT